MILTIILVIMLIISIGLTIYFFMQRKQQPITQCSKNMKSIDLLSNGLTVNGIYNAVCDDGAKLTDININTGGVFTRFPDLSKLVYTKDNLDKGFAIMPDCVGKKPSGYTIDNGKLKLTCK